MKKISLLLHTIRYLKAKQVYYRLFYFARAKYRRLIGYRPSFVKASSASKLKLGRSLPNHYSIVENKRFDMLNLAFEFQDRIDWNFAEYGKLWTYNLTYFEYLKNKDDIWLIYDFINNIENIKDGLEPFPISLRGMNWIKFLTKFDIDDKKIDDSLYAQYYMLLDHLEYHLLGNHLLENGFSLLFGAYYFQDEKLYAQAKEILSQELEEQVLDDGGHFELTPMYHQLMLFRLLDCIDLVKNNEWQNRELLALLTHQAQKMLGWLENITLQSGDIPLLNDSAKKIAPTSKELFAYAQNLEIDWRSEPKRPLKASGYRKVVTKEYECVVDVGEVGASYIPGHAHADTLNFVMNVNTQPFIVDSGLSTYETGDQRAFQRSTKAHNTVEVNQKDSSEVWGGFRVANRANIVELQESKQYIKASHDGYRGLGVVHTREWRFEENRIKVIDRLSKESDAVFRVHFHPSVTKEEINQKVICHCPFSIQTYDHAEEFNKTQKALVLEIPFTTHLEVEIML